MKIAPLIGAVAGLLAAGCTPVLDDRVSAANGASLFAENCAACHGPQGRGYDGPSRDWTPPPDLSLLSQRNGGVFPEIATLATIYGSVGHIDPERTMPEFGAGDLGPTVVVEVEEGVGTPIPADLVALAEYLRTIQR
ncbi:cytochrome c [Rhodobacteraceae bacterium N5(2021)]|uniref:Cytochrome c n=1 Tax=Gymnodinialimonas phycosphaerae TaxID=2841589 RepID=A0A975TWI8_9RHOB|nr:cytochrome c [Gymnodinialimonas phycosphaerae]MBY4892245.1 cytochrome c [Gymnodinialimonas phycosphaerae]